MSSSGAGAWRGMAAVLVFLWGPPQTLAQTPPTSPPITGNLVPQGSPIPRVLPPRPPAVGLGLPVPPPQPPSAVPAVAVPVRSATVEGATAYPPERLASLIAGLTGPAVPLARVEAARAALLNLYRRDGYALTSVSARIGSGGDLSFVVTEGRVADVKLEGDIGPAGVQVLRFLSRLLEYRPVTTAVLERWLLLAQDVPGVAVRAVLRPAADDPGALTLVAQVSRQAFNGLLTADNRASRLTGPVQSLAVLSANAFTQLGERTEASIYHTEGNTQNFGQVSTEVFAGSSGLRVRLYGGYGEANPSEFLRAIGYHGTTTIFGVGATYPLIRQRRQTLNLQASLDAVETEISTTETGQRSRASRDALRILRAGGDYAFEDLLLGGERPGVNLVSTRVSQGIPSLGATGNDNPQPGRPNERVDFTKVSFDLSRTQALFQPWDRANVALRLRVAGQASGDVLPPAEKFFLGGTELNRGFYAGQVSGDTALSGTVELQLNTGSDVQAFGRSFDVTTQFYAFFDRGQTWENRREDPNLRLSSEGLGARLFLTRYTEFDVEGVIRNTRVPQGTQGVVRPLKAEAVFWRVLTRF